MGATLKPLPAKPKRIPELKSLARLHTERAVQVIAGVMDSGASEAARLTAADILLSRGWGRPSQPTEAKVDGELRITIRKMLKDLDE
jgi:hypothetical protein